MNIPSFVAEVRNDADHPVVEYENVPHGMPPPQDVPNARLEREMENNADTSHKPSASITKQSTVPEYVNVSSSPTPSSALEKSTTSGQHQYEDLGPRPYVAPSEYDRIQ